jgi:hypothetical protein
MATSVRFRARNGLDNNNNTIINVSNPTNNQDVATKSYVDTHTTDATLHLTSAQNTWIDSITATATEINYLVGTTSSVQTQLNSKLNLSGGSMTGNIVVPTGSHVSIADAPTNGLHAANKNYVDANIAGLTWKNAVRAATTANITLSGTQTIDGVSVVAGNRVLVKNQTALAQNGIYLVAAGAWTRAIDMDATTPINELNSAAVFVEQGTSNQDTGWTQVNNIVNLNTDPVSFVQFTGSESVTAGVGLSKTGNQLDVNLGAGISQLPTDEVGIDVFSSGGLMTTVDGSSSSTLTNAQLALTNVGTPGTYRSVTTDAKGRVTAGTNPTTLAGYGITDATPSSHLTDDTRHLTSAQNTWIDAITATSTEVNYISGTTSSVQNQLNSKLNLSGGTMSGDLTVNANITGSGFYGDGSNLTGIGTENITNINIISQSLKYRQTVLSGPINGTTGLPDYISLSGNNISSVNIDTQNPLNITFADGYGNNADFYAAISASQSNITTFDSDFTGTQYLYCNYETPTEVSWGTTKTTCQYGTKYSNPSQALLPFNTTARYDDLYGNVWSRGSGAVITLPPAPAVAPPFGSLILNLTGNNSATYLQCQDIDNLGNGCWSVSCYINIPVGYTSGVDDVFSFLNDGQYGARISFQFTAGTTVTPRVYLSNNGTSWNMASNIAGPAIAGYSTSSWYRLVLNFNGEEYSCAFGLASAATIPAVTIVSSSLKICPITKARLGYRGSSTEYPRCSMSEFAFLRKSVVSINNTVPRLTTAQTVEGDFFNINEMAMYSVTGSAPYNLVTIPFGASNIDIANEVITAASNTNFVGGERVVFIYSGTMPGGILNTNSYYVVDSSYLYDVNGNNISNRFQISLTPGGAPVNITSVGAGTGYIVVSSNPTLTKIDRVYVGEINRTFTTNYNNIDLYSYRGEYTTDWIPVVTGTQYYLKHYIGTGLVDFDTYFNTYRSDMQSFKVTVTGFYDGAIPGNRVAGCLIASTGNNTFSFNTMDSSAEYLDHAFSSVLANTDFGRQTKGYYKIVAKRAW